MQKQDLRIHLEDDVLIIQGEHKEEKEENGRYTRREFMTSSFERTFRLPKMVDGEKVQAKYDNGILRLNLPKKAEAVLQGPKEIRVSWSVVIAKEPPSGGSFFSLNANQDVCML